MNILINQKLISKLTNFDLFLKKNKKKQKQNKELIQLISCIASNMYVDVSTKYGRDLYLKNIATMIRSGQLKSLLEFLVEQEPSFKKVFY